MLFIHRTNLQKHERNLRVHKVSVSVKKSYEISTLLFIEDKELNENDKTTVAEASSLDVSHAGKLICWTCQEELSSASPGA